MSNIKKIRRPKITLLLDIRNEEDKEVELKFSLKSYSCMEEEYGSIDAAMDAIKSKSMKAVQFMLWAGLQHNEDNLSLDEVGSAMDMRDMDYYMDKVSAAMDSDSPNNAVTVTEGPNS